MLREKFRRLTAHSYPLSIPKEGNILELVHGIQPPTSGFQNPKTFIFLNQSHTFEGNIDWNISKYGKLWAYNLNYFDYLHQRDMTKEVGLKLIRAFINQIETNNEGLEPYPISLRGINWIKFLSKYDVKDEQIDAGLYAQYQILLDNLEYHVMGNHLLENGLSLIFGAFYFQDDELWKKGKQLVIGELEEQILKDGSHYERSVMYHCIIMERLMDCYNLVNHNDWISDAEPEAMLKENIELMLGWLGEMTVDGKPSAVPEVNDHVPEMTPSLSELKNYADRLSISAAKVKLGESGYRKYQGENFEILLDVGDIGPDYVLGHAHSDIFSFLLRVNGKEIITDTGTSTYGDNPRRQIERSTSAHNTVVVEGKEQNEVWSAFRVGRRGHVEVIAEQENKIVARHDGYEFIGIIHERQFEFDSDRIIIRDHLKGKGSGDKKSGMFYLHFDSGIEVEVADDVIEGKQFRISFTGHTSIDLGVYKKALGYNRTRKAHQIAVGFNNEMITNIKIF